MATKRKKPRPAIPASERAIWSVDDIADQGGPKRTRIFQAMKAGELPSHKIGGRRYATRENALAWLRGEIVAKTVAPVLEGHATGPGTGRTGRGAISICVLSFAPCEAAVTALSTTSTALAGVMVLIHKRLKNHGLKHEHSRGRAAGRLDGAMAPSCSAVAFPWMVSPGAPRPWRPIPKSWLRSFFWLRAGASSRATSVRPVSRCTSHSASCWPPSWSPVCSGVGPAAGACLPRSPGCSTGRPRQCILRCTGYYSRSRRWVSCSAGPRASPCRVDLLIMLADSVGYGIILTNSNREAKMDSIARGTASAALTLQSCSPVQFSHDIAGRGPEFFKAACQRHLEGIISKRATSPYRSGRGGDWVKTKCVLRQEFVIGGYRYSTRDPGRDLGSLLIGYYDRGKLIYAGSVGTGWSIQLGRSILAKLQRIAVRRLAIRRRAQARRQGRPMDRAAACRRGGIHGMDP